MTRTTFLVSAFLVVGCSAHHAAEPMPLPSLPPPPPPAPVASAPPVVVTRHNQAAYARARSKEATVVALPHATAEMIAKLRKLDASARLAVDSLAEDAARRRHITQAELTTARSALRALEHIWARWFREFR
jgi:hypothetical protein